MAAQLPPIEPDGRRTLALVLLEKGRRSRETGVEVSPTRAEFTAYA